jgi:polygalacturonase
MKKPILLCLSLLLSLASLAGNDYGKYYQNMPKPMPQVTAPTIPSNTVSITEAGGVGDGITMNTEAFNKAISKLSKLGGGHLEVPAGIYVTGLISFKDNIDLHLCKNAIIVASPDKNDHYKMEDGKKDSKPTPLINASKRKNISITGEGVIDGNGEYWRAVKRGKQSDVEWNQYKEMGGTLSEKGDIWYPFNLTHFDNIASSAEAQENLRTHLIRLTDCENILIQGITVMNSPKFHIVPQRCKNIIIDGVTMKCPWNAQNGDAMDIGNCQNVLIVNNTIDAGDDGICMKGGAGQSGVDNGPCENINIQDNVVYHAHGGFVIGSEFSGGMKNILVRNNRFNGTDTGLRFKSAIKRGGESSDIYIDHIYMTDIKDQAIVFQCDYWDNHVGALKDAATQKAEFVPNFKDIHISDVVCRGAAIGISAHGEPGMVHDITIDNCTFFYTKQAQDIDANCKIKVNNVKFSTFSK